MLPLITALALAGAPLPAVDPGQFPQPGSQPADVIMMQLESMGYSVNVNWTNNGIGVPLARCQVSGYHAPGDTDIPAETTVYLDVVCPDED